MKEKGFFTQTKLKNGLRVISENISSVRSVSLGFWVKIGSRDEKNHQAGISHFIEHLLFKGTKKHSAAQIAEIFDSIGGELNAYSAKEYTCFYGRVLDEHLPIAVEVLSDVLQNPLFREKDIAAEKRVVLEEIRFHRDQPAELVHDYFDANLWFNHPLGNSVLGEADTIRQLSRRELINYFQQGYQPANIVVAAAGNVSHNKLIQLIKKELSADGQEELRREKLKPRVEARISVYPKKTNQAHICYGTEGLPRNHPDRFVLAVLDTILGGGMSSRLYQKIREKRGLAYSIYSYHAQFTETGVIAVYAGTKPSKAKEVVKLIREEIEILSQDGITLKELERAKEHLKGNLVLGMEDTTTRMSRLGKGELCQTEILSTDELINRINKVTLEDVARLSKEIFQAGKMVLTVVGPFKPGSFDEFEC